MYINGNKVTKASKRDHIMLTDSFSSSLEFYVLIQKKCSSIAGIG